MKFISHRGNLTGPSLLENSPAQIEKCIKLGFDVEVDLWHEDHHYYLGHDESQYYVPMTWLVKWKDKLWIHCKNPQSLFYMMDKNKDFDGFNFFYHNNDDYTLISNGMVWVYPGKELLKNSICCMPEWGIGGDLSICYAICTDEVLKYKELI